MKIGEWEGIGRSRALVTHQLGELGADEFAAHVTMFENGRQRIMVAADVGLFEFAWGPNSAEPDAIWYLRGGLTRWPSVKGLRLQTDAQFDPVGEKVQSIWRLVADEPKLELASTTEEDDPKALPALLDFARACIQHVA
jgi:hypothetical protein